MNPANDFNSSASSFCFPDLNEDHIPENEQYGSTTTYPVLPQTPASSNNSLETDQINSADHCNSSTAEVVRVCSDCNTTKTPIWRGGPQGPKSLCNACGIRQRKARKAIALAAQNDIESVHNMDHYSSIGPSNNHKGKKLRTRYHDVTHSHQTTSKSKISFEDFAMSLINRKSTKLFPQDEEEAAILLMVLSCGLIHN